MPSSYYWLLHLVMIAGGAYLTADMANIGLASYLEGALETPQYARPSRSEEPLPGKTLISHNYQGILKKNIFNSRANEVALDENVTPEIATVETAPVNLPPLNMSLIGTVVLKGSTPYAVIKEKSKREQSIYRKDDMVAGIARLIEIDRTAVVLLYGGRREVLELTLEKKKPGKALPVSRRVTPPAPKSGETIRKLSENEWVLDRREIDEAMKNLPQLLTKARIIPNFKDGKPDGFRIFAIARDSLFAKIGLQNGDILNRINSVDVKNPQNFMKVLEQLKDENSINIDLVRSNQKQTFNYDIR